MARERPLSAEVTRDTGPLDFVEQFIGGVSTFTLILIDNCWRCVVGRCVGIASLDRLSEMLSGIFDW